MSRSHFCVVSGVLSIVVGRITKCRGRDATMIWTPGEFRRVLMKDFAFVFALRERRWSDRPGIVVWIEGVGYGVMCKVSRYLSKASR